MIIATIFSMLLMEVISVIPPCYEINAVSFRITPVPTRCFICNKNAQDAKTCANDQEIIFGRAFARFLNYDTASVIQHAGDNADDRDLMRRYCGQEKKLWRTLCTITPRHPRIYSFEWFSDVSNVYN